MPERIEAICDLLVAAAYADKRFLDSERALVTKLLCAMQGTDTLEPRLAARIESTDPATIDPMETAALLADDTEENRRILIQLIRSVNDADGEWDNDEEELVIVVAVALGFSLDEIEEFISHAAPPS